MLLNLTFVLCLFFLSLQTFAQSVDSSPIKSESDLFSALIEVKQDDISTIRGLLQSHSNFVTPTLWKRINDVAPIAYFSSQPERLLWFYQIDEEIAIKLNDRRLIATAYYNIGRAYSGLAKYPQAIEAYLASEKEFAAVGMQHDLVYISSDLGALYFNLEDYERAMYYSERSISLAQKLQTVHGPQGAYPDEYGVAGALSTLGELNAREGNYSQAIENLQEALSIYQKLSRDNNSYTVFIADSYAALGRLYTTVGEQTKALAHLNKALDAAKASFQLDRVASIYNSIGYLYLEQEEYEQAGDYFNRGLEIYTAEKNRRESARVLLNLAVISQRRADFAQALTLFSRSLKEAEAASSKEIMIAATEGIGVALTGQGNYSLAIKTLDDGLNLAKNINDKMRQSELLWREAEAFYAMGYYAQAEMRALEAQNLARRLRLSKLSFLTATTLGQVYLKENKAELAERSLRQAIDGIEAMREAIAGREEETEMFFEKRVAPYHALIDLFLRQNRPYDALIYAERAKARVLLDVLRDGRRDATAVMTSEEKIEEQKLNREIYNLNERIRCEESGTATDSENLTALYSQLEAVRVRYESFLNSVNASHPQLNLRRNMTSPLSIGDLNALLTDSHRAYLEYVVTKEKTYVFVLTRKGANNTIELKVFPIEITADELAKKVAQFHHRIADRSPLFALSAREMYDILIRPVARELDGIATICLVLDGSLWNLPFQALLSATERYLVEDFALSSAPSLGVLQEMAKRRRSQARHSELRLLAFGNPDIAPENSIVLQTEKNIETLCPLPDAEAEVVALNQIFGERGKRISIGAEASEKSFKLLAPSYRILHLATHGVLDDRHPLYSYLLLAKTEGDTENDGRLEAREIIRMRLNADLAVLSACETGRGRIGAGEGVIGMSWAFLIAGCRATVVSQWKVNSASTAQLMMNFYQALEIEKNNPNQERGAKSLSLRAAALALMKDERYRHPFYWAGFVMIGSDE
jgi:CHAT domain-containing protein